jgi:hypothetical protein
VQVNVGNVIGTEHFQNDERHLTARTLTERDENSRYFRRPDKTKSARKISSKNSGFHAFGAQADFRGLLK